VSTPIAIAPADPDDDARRRAAEPEHARANEAAARALAAAVRAAIAAETAAETAPPKEVG